MKRVILPTEEGTRNETEKDVPPSAATPSAVERRPSKQKQSLPPEVMEILAPSLKVGAVAGTCGLFAGAAAGIVRSAPTLFFSIISGGQWFTLGTSYYAARQVGLKYFGEGEQTPRDKLKASTVAGGVAGTIGGALRGPRNILPGALMFSLFGAGGQAIVNWRAAKAANAPLTTNKGFWSRWSPVTALSDEDYANLLEEKLLRVEADIAVVDDHIKELRESERQTKMGESQEPGTSTTSSSEKA
ncbi:hypothetical protein VTI74DRAFT_8433 [Chaetomium olivicolor]